MEISLVPIFNESHNVTRVSLLLHPLDSFLDDTTVPFCLIHAHHFFLCIQELIWLKGIKCLADHLPVTVQIQPTSPEQEKE